MSIIREQALVVLHPFASYKKGQIITDPNAIAAVKQNGQMTFVVSTQVLIQSSISSKTDMGK